MVSDPKKISTPPFRFSGLLAMVQLLVNESPQDRYIQMEKTKQIKSKQEKSFNKEMALQTIDPSCEPFCLKLELVGEAALS